MAVSRPFSVAKKILVCVVDEVPSVEDGLTLALLGFLVLLVNAAIGLGIPCKSFCNQTARAHVA